MDEPSDEGSGDRDDRFDYDPFEDDAEEGAGDDPAEWETPPAEGSDETGRRSPGGSEGAEARPASGEATPGTAEATVGTTTDSSGVLGVNWGPERDDVSILSRLWSVVVAIGLGVAGFVVAIFAFQVASLVLIVAGIEQLTFVGDLIVGFVVLQGTSFPIVALIYLRFRGLPLSYLGIDIPGLRDVAWVVGGFLLVVALVTAVIVAITVTNAPQAERSDTEGFQENPDAILLMIPVSVLLIGPAEELLFRGVVQSRLRETFGPAGAIVFANFAFAPLHVFALQGSPTALAVTIGGLFVPGLVFGVAYEFTGNLTVPALIHGLYNATIFTLFYVSASAGAVLA
ncbi:hypothetical protein BRD00_05085 [Halobacteriales archaeon QS_8_69_26]|nr:MAG: hypothetical protein BRD00_05085 [Halobacteriales archaeon QS_8_69_26]